jgi:hypothetical protein
MATVEQPQHLYVQHLGQVIGPLDIETVRQMAKDKVVAKENLARLGEDGLWFPLRQVAGVFSRREHLPAMIISWTVGWFGIDRFYLGYKAIGTVKLLVSLSTGVLWLASFPWSGEAPAEIPSWFYWLYIPYGLAFIWHAADMIRIATRHLPDADGLPLA